MGKVNYLLLDMSVLPEVYVKVIEAKGYLQSGEAAEPPVLDMRFSNCYIQTKGKKLIFQAFRPSLS